MTRNSFTRVLVTLEQLHLDQKNARIRHGSSQSDCIARLLKKEKQAEQILTLMKDIAEHGLSTTTILVSPGQQPDTWVVRDGNRRVTAMKLYMEPELANNPEIASKVHRLKQRYPDINFEPLEVLSSANESAIWQEIRTRHNGEMDGAGLVTWSSYLRTLSLVEAGAPAEYRIPALYLTWAEERNIFVDDDFPLSTLQRFFKQENLAALGVRFEGNTLQLELPESTVLSMAQRVIGDFQPGQPTMTVDQVFTDSLAKAYLSRVRASVGLAPNSTASNQADQSKQSKQTPQSPPVSVDGLPKTDHVQPLGVSETSSGPQQPQGDRGRAKSSPQSNPLDRKKLFGKRPPELQVPESEIKVRDIVRLLRELDVQTQTLAVAMLLRHLIESSEDAYRGKHSLPTERLGRAVRRSAERMFSQGRLTSDARDVVIRMCDANANGLVSIETLQNLMHRRENIPNGNLINALWDQIGPFVRECWAS